MVNKYNLKKLSQELVSAGITTHGNCNSNGVVWDDDNKEIQDRTNVKAVLAAHDPTPEAVETLDEKIVRISKEEIAKNALIKEAIEIT